MLIDLLGIDPAELDWRDLALCNGMETNLFYDDYEGDEQVAKVIDDACLSCPVMAQCLKYAVDNNEWGTWGGIYMVSGRPDESRNAHKTPQVWKAIRERISDKSIL